MTKPTAIGAYIFAGGFTLGVREHFEVRAHLEESKYGVATFTKNQPGIPVYFPPENWPISTLKRDHEPIHFVYGNPPCAAWSGAGAATKKGRSCSSSWRPKSSSLKKASGLSDTVLP